MKLFKWILLSLCLMLVACASDSRYRVEKPFLYEVSKGPQKGYLFGTIHTGVAIDDLPKEFWPYFDQSDNIAIEANFDKANDYVSEFKQKLVRKPNEPTLQSRMSPEDFQIFKNLLQKEIPKQAGVVLQHLSPYGAFTLLAGILVKKTSVDMDRGEAVRYESKFMLDQGLFKRAQEQQKIVTFLDSKNVTALISCLAGQEDFYLKSIHDLLRNPAAVSQEVDHFRKLIKAYREGNSEELQKYTHDLPVEMDTCLIVNRNQSWMNQIVSNLETYSQPFFAVGAGHIETANGSLIQLLKERGYEVRRIPFK